jgi:hypothetical protein
MLELDLQQDQQHQVLHREVVATDLEYWSLRVLAEMCWKPIIHEASFGKNF